MPYHIDWVIRRRVVHLHVSDLLTLSDIAAASDQVVALYDQAAGSVDMITQLSNISLTDVDIQNILRAAACLRHPALRYWVIYGSTNPMFYYMGRVISRITHKQFTQTTTLEQALTLLIRLDPTLNDLNTPTTRV